MNSKKNKDVFQQMNDELNNFYEYLKRKEYKDEEIREIFKPLTSKIKRNRNYRKAPYCVLYFLIFILFLYILSCIDYFSWIFSAMGRIFLIKMLPYYDWTHLKYQKCWISSPYDFFSSKKYIEKNFNCDLCENIPKIDVFQSIDEDILQEKYIDLHIPLILTRGIGHWITHKNFTKTILKYDSFYYSQPCKLSSNIINEEITSGQILERTKNFESFFLHFQNCEIEAKKVVRMFTFRPDYLPELISPIMYNWIVWNKNYEMSNFKKVPLVENLAVFGQIIGKTLIKLSPRKNCENACPVLNLDLNPGESVIVTSLWDLEYKSEGNGENLAAILEFKM